MFKHSPFIFYFLLNRRFFKNPSIPLISLSSFHFSPYNYFHLVWTWLKRHEIPVKTVTTPGPMKLPQSSGFYICIQIMVWMYAYIHLLRAGVIYKPVMLFVHIPSYNIGRISNKVTKFSAIPILCHTLRKHQK